MTDYSPHCWVAINFVPLDSNEPPVLKIMGSWYGGYLDSDTWRLNSGVKEIVERPDHYECIGFSGSKYLCGKNSYGLSSYAGGVLDHWKRENEKQEFPDIIRVFSLEEFTRGLQVNPFANDAELNIKVTLLTDGHHTDTKR